MTGYIDKGLMSGYRKGVKDSGLPEESRLGQGSWLVEGTKLGEGCRHLDVRLKERLKFESSLHNKVQAADDVDHTAKFGDDGTDL